GRAIIRDAAAVHARPPVLHPAANGIDDLELDFLARLALEQLGLVAARAPPAGMFRHAVEVARPAAAISLVGGLRLLDLPVTLRFCEGRVDDRGLDLGNGERGVLL